MASSTCQDPPSSYDEVVRRFGDATEPALREQVVWALLHKGNELGQLERPQEALAAASRSIPRERWSCFR
jgi:hypothetical protein